MKRPKPRAAARRTIAPQQLTRIAAGSSRGLDILIGNTGSDRYGGWGNDLMNADDVMG